MKRLIEKAATVNADLLVFNGLVTLEVTTHVGDAGCHNPSVYQV